MADITKINESPQKAQTSAFEDLRAELAHLLKKKAEKTVNTIYLYFHEEKREYIQYNCSY